MKTKRFLLAAGIVLAMVFTLSCSSDDDEKTTTTSGNLACYAESSPLPDVEICVQFTAAVSAEFCQFAGSSYNVMMIPQESCPPEPILNCPTQEGQVINFYGPSLGNVTCEMIDQMLSGNP